jgi:hypothetical protein
MGQTWLYGRAGTLRKTIFLTPRHLPACPDFDYLVLVSINYFGSLVHHFVSFFIKILKATSWQQQP